MQATETTVVGLNWKEFIKIVWNHKFYWGVGATELETAPTFMADIDYHETISLIVHTSGPVHWIPLDVVAIHAAAGDDSPLFLYFYTPWVHLSGKDCSVAVRESGMWAEEIESFFSGRGLFPQIKAYIL